MRRTLTSLLACGSLLAVVTMSCSRNQPPARPGLSGPTAGNVGDTLTYTFSTTDPENQELEYMVAWGDTSAVEWSPFYPSGQTVTRTHIFTTAGVYHVKVKARDTKQAESDWSDSLVASIVLVQGGPPTGVAVSAGPGDSDSTVIISWTTPAESTPDKYVVHFRAVSDSGYVVLGETTATSYAHNPHGMTGWYKVAAVFGTTAHEGTERPSTVPIATDSATPFEINAAANQCGFGWARDSGTGRIYSMADSANCRFVDLYVSDLAVGVGSPLCLVSPDRAMSIDPGATGTVPSAAWHINGFSNPLLNAHDPVPRYEPPPNATYFIYTEITSQPCNIGCYTAGDTLKHYALIRVDSADAAAGKVWLKTWYQLVPGLRLMRH